MNNVARMHEREGLMAVLDSTSVLQSFLLSVVGSVQAIRFSIEWKPLTKAEKAKFRLDVFHKVNPNHATWSKDNYKQELRNFKSRHEKVITARNEIKSLFMKVG